MLLLAALLAAQTPTAETACDRLMVALPSEFAAWRGRSPRTASTGLGAPPLLPPGEGADFSLAPMDKLAFDVAPATPAKPGTYGGMFRFRVDQAGIVRLALGGEVDVTLIRDGTPVAPVDQGAGVACTGMQALLGFAVERGEYLVEIANSPKPVLPAMVTDPE